MFSSYALRPWSPRAANLALIGAITVYITGGGHIAVGRIGWFVLAAVIGLGWLALWESLLLPDDPLRSLQRSVHAFSRRTGDTVAAAVDVLNTVRDGSPSARRRKALHANLEKVRACRAAIERQSPGAIVHGFSRADADQLRVTLHSAQKGLEDMAKPADAPGWMQSLPEEMAWSITSTLHALAVALREDVDDEESRDLAARTAQALRGQIHDALTHTTTTGEAPFEPAALLAALTVLSGGEVVARSVTQAILLADNIPESGRHEQLATAPGVSSPVASAQPDRGGLSPTMTLAIQSVVAAVAAGAIAKLIGNEQSLVVAWTAFVVIAGSAGLSTRRAMTRIPATTLGAVGGVLIAATVPDSVGWTIAVVAVGVFFTIVTAPVSYPAMVFWMGIAFVPLFATEGRYLDLVIARQTDRPRSHPWRGHGLAGQLC